jgi:hypothetical protein
MRTDNDFCFFEGALMNVAVTSNGEVVWAREIEGATAATFVGDGCQSSKTKQRIIAALAEALEQARGQLGGLDVVDAVVDVRATTAKIDRDVPITVVGNRDTSGQSLEEAAIGRMLATGAIRMKIGIVRKPHIALVAALHNDNVAGI